MRYWQKLQASLISASANQDEQKRPHRFLSEHTGDTALVGPNETLAEDVPVSRCTQTGLTRRQACWKGGFPNQAVPTGRRDLRVVGGKGGRQPASPIDLRVMPSLTIMDSKVVGFRPRISAAPPFPRIRQPVMSSTLIK